MTEPLRLARVATLLLLLVTAVWGSTFFLIRDLVETVPPADFLTVRFAIAAVVMFAVFRRQTLALSRADLRLGVGLGVLYGLAQLLQTVGLQHTDASVSGFVTGTYVVLTPLLGALLLRDRIDAVTWVAVLLTTAGLAVLSLKGLSVGFGEGVTLASAGLTSHTLSPRSKQSTPLIFAPSVGSASSAERSEANVDAADAICLVGKDDDDDDDDDDYGRRPPAASGKMTRAEV